MSPITEQRFATPHPIRLEVRIPAGEVHVSSADAPESAVSVEGSRDLLDDMKIELVGERLIVEPRRKAFVSLFGRSEHSVHVRATVPDHSRLAITTASADSTLEGVFGGLEARSASGYVTAGGQLHGDVVTKTASGDVRLGQVDGDLEVRTVSGETVVDTVTGAVSVRSVSGDVRVGSFQEGRANVQSVSGHVALGIAAGRNLDVDAVSASGELRSDFPLAEAAGHDAGPTVVVRGKTVSGRFRLFRAA